MLTGKVRYEVTDHPTWKYVNTAPVHIPMPGLPVRRWVTKGDHGYRKITMSSIRSDFPIGEERKVRLISGLTPPQIITEDDSLIEIIMNSDGIYLYGPYAWDGASGPAIDTPSSIANSLPHDIGYQFIRMGLLPVFFKRVFDSYLYTCMSYSGDSVNPFYVAWRKLRGAGYLAAVHVGGWWALRGKGEE